MPRRPRRGEAHPADRARFRPEAAAGIREGDEVDVDLTSGQIRNLTSGQTFQARPLPEFVMKIAEAGGIVNFLKTHEIEELL